MNIPDFPRAIIVSLLAGAVLAAPAAAQPLATHKTATSNDSARATCPLTGRAVPEGMKAKRAAVAVKIDNTAGRNAQSGLESADIVIEHPVEGGLTRFSAVYHCKDADAAGPVRSARIDDGALLEPLTDVLAYSGANRIVNKELRLSGMTSVTEADSKALSRIPGKEAPFDLFANTRAVRAASDSATRPNRLFQFGRLPRNAAKTKTVSLSFGGATDVSYSWADGAWRRAQDGTPFLKSDGGRFSIANVLVQQVQVDSSEHLFDALGNPSPELTLDGRGRALLFRNGAVIKGSWRSHDGVVKFMRKDGSPMPFDVGQTWWEIAPSGSGTVAGTIDF